MLEKDLIKQIRSYLKTEDIDCIKHHGSVFSEAGVSDLICVMPTDGRALFIEVKIGKNLPTELQLHFLERMRRSGAVALWVNSVEQVKQVIHNSHLTHK